LSERPVEPIAPIDNDADVELEVKFPLEEIHQNAEKRKKKNKTFRIKKARK
jgi:hypothetical protein